MKWFFTFIFGFAAGVAATFLIDRKGTTERFNRMKEDMDDLENIFEEKVQSYKKAYNDTVDKVAESGKKAIEKTKSRVNLN